MIDLTQTIESCLYVMDKIRPEIEKGNFRAVYRYTQHLEQLVRFAAIAQERHDSPPIIIELPNYD